MHGFRNPSRGRMMPSAARLALLLLVPLLAGCADDAAPTTEADDPFADQPTDVATGKGVIRGVVVDSAVSPVPDATVLLRATEATATTDENGAFYFSDIEPGTHFIQVDKPGWETIQQSIDVQADVAKPPIVKVQLLRAPGTEPFAETFSAEGFVQCGWGTPVNLGTCPGLDGDDRSTVTIPFSRSPDWVQSEVIWDSNQPAGAQLYLIMAVCGDPCAFDFDERFDEGNRDSPAIARTQYNGTIEQGHLGVIASAGGPANGTGVALDQVFQVYGSFFYNMEPQDGWSFTADGPHPY